MAENTKELVDIASHEVNEAQALRAGLDAHLQELVDALKSLPEEIASAMGQQCANSSSAIHQPAAP